MTVLVLVLTAVYCLQGSVECGQACPGGWTGEQCRYLCHCQDNLCHPLTGDCTDGVRCQNGWFGPACQYVDLIYEAEVTQHLRDHNIGTCHSSSQLVISFSSLIQFTWATLVSSDIESILELDMSFDYGKQCIHVFRQRQDNQTVHVECSDRITTRIIKLTSYGRAMTLCELRVSGGRNVALKQPTDMSLPYNLSWDFYSQLAVDGRAGGQGGTHCARSQPSPVRALWALHFRDRPYVLYKLVLHAAGGEGSVSMRGFGVELLDREGQSLLSWTDSSKSHQSRYNFHIFITSPVYQVRLLSTEAGLKGFSVQICELELFGDMACEAGWYGLECQHRCGSCLNLDCSPSSGLCRQGCAVGMQGDRCDTACDKGTYGQTCGKLCPIHCREAVCDHVTGRCMACQTGFTGPSCQQACPPGSFGDQCKQSCPVHCAGRLCHRVNGSCLQCQSGFMGETCDTDCLPGKHGPGCWLDCPSQCQNGLCDASTGLCHLCQPGYSGPRCQSGSSGLWTVLLWLVIGLALAVCLLWTLRTYTPDNPQSEVKLMMVKGPAGQEQAVASMSAHPR